MQKSTYRFIPDAVNHTRPICYLHFVKQLCHKSTGRPAFSDGTSGFTLNSSVLITPATDFSYLNTVCKMTFCPNHLFWISKKNIPIHTLRKGTRYGFGEDFSSMYSFLVNSSGSIFASQARKGTIAQMESTTPTEPQVYQLPNRFFTSILTF